jgi:hypothetical protein
MDEKRGSNEKQPLKPAAAIVSLIIVGVIAFSCSRACTKDEAPPSSSGASSSSAAASAATETRDINARVSFNGTQFAITNLETRAWTNVRFEVNPGLISSGYTLKVQRVEAGATHTVGAAQFANSAGERFNPFTHKPLEFSILEFSSTWPEQTGLEGSVSFGWE